MMETMNLDGGWRRSPWRGAMWLGAIGLLLVPLVAMRFTSEVNWDETDFIVMGTMLVIVCGSFELVARASESWLVRAAGGLAILTGFVLVWSNLAVGFIGNEDNPLNLMFAGVIAIAVGGTIVARRSRAGLAAAMTLSALGQAVAGGIGMAFGYPVLAPTIVFVGLWLASALLFRTAARGA